MKAAGVRFELTILLRVYLFSRQAYSTTLAPRPLKNALLLFGFYIGFYI